MISGRPRGEHLSGSFKHTHTHTETHSRTSTQPRGLDVVIAVIRPSKVLDGSDRSVVFVYQSK